MAFAELGEDLVSGVGSTCSNVFQASAQTFFREPLGDHVLEVAFDGEALRQGLGGQLGFDFGLKVEMDHLGLRVAEQGGFQIDLARRKAEGLLLLALIADGNRIST